ncbi:MAG: glutamate--tRNA ligase [Rubricoccaceae bacterium]|nr:glutamate--tRNA ligase [Rubricoccaceae bacterium]
MPVRVRFAPSPTGLLHIGGLRTALYNYLLARQSEGGAFLLRIEDTDRSRYVEGAEEDIVESLRWAGLEIDEGPAVGGPHAPYRQSERTEQYRAAVDRLVADGQAYIAFDTPEALEAMRERLATPESPAPTYGAATRERMTNALTLPPEEVQRRLDEGEPHVVRLRVTPGESVTFDDAIRGPVTFQTDEVDDQVLLKSDGLPTYHLANVVDDHAMQITHVVRGEEWLPSTPKHILLYRALGWEAPQFAHLPLILSPSGGKLSKRKAEQAGVPVFVCQYRGEDACPPDLVPADAPRLPVEPEALVNFLALLGWSPGDDRERFTLEELVGAFRLDRVTKSGAQLDLDKLAWLNGQVLRDLSDEALAERARPAVEARVGPVEEARLVAAAALLRERLTVAHDLAEATYLFQEPEAYDEAGVKRRWKDDSARLVALYADRLEADAAFTEASTEAAMRQLAEDEGVGFGRIIHPVRLATTGTTVGAGMFETLVVIGRAATIRRLRRAVEVLG